MSDGTIILNALKKTAGTKFYEEPLPDCEVEVYSRLPSAFKEPWPDTRGFSRKQKLNFLNQTCYTSTVATQFLMIVAEEVKFPDMTALQSAVERETALIDVISGAFRRGTVRWRGSLRNPSFKCKTGREKYEETMMTHKNKSLRGNCLDELRAEDSITQRLKLDATLEPSVSDDTAASLFASSPFMAWRSPPRMSREQAEERVSHLRRAQAASTTQPWNSWGQRSGNHPLAVGPQQASHVQAYNMGSTADGNMYTPSTSILPSIEYDSVSSRAASVEEDVSSNDLAIKTEEDAQ